LLNDEFLSPIALERSQHHADAGLASQLGSLPVPLWIFWGRNRGLRLGSDSPACEPFRRCALNRAV